MGLLPGRSCSKKFKVSAEITLTSWSCDRQRQRQPHTVAAQEKQRQRVYNEITRAHATKAAAAAAGARASQGPALHKVNLSFVKPLQEMMIMMIMIMSICDTNMLIKTDSLGN